MSSVKSEKLCCLGCNIQIKFVNNLQNEGYFRYAVIKVVINLRFKQEF